MTVNEDRKQLRKLRQRITIKKEDLARLREELSALTAERKAIKEKLAAEAGTAEADAPAS